MTAVTTVPWSREMTAADFAAWQAPDDGRRWELLDGVLVVSPSPFVAHQVMSWRLHTLLSTAAPDHLYVLAAPLDVRLSERTVVQPDLVVVRADHATGDRLTGLPLLVVEILSDSTRGHDLLLKRDRYEAAGIESYWVIDPGTGETVAWELTDGAYTQAAHGSVFDTGVHVTRPFDAHLRITR